MWRTQTRHQQQQLDGGAIEKQPPREGGVASRQSPGLEATVNHREAQWDGWMRHRAVTGCEGHTQMPRSCGGGGGDSRRASC